MYRKLFSASVLVMGLGLVINLVGVFKEQLVAYQFGVNEIIDVYSMALALPLLFAGVLGSSVNAAVIPAFLEARERRAESLFFKEVGRIIVLFAVGLTLICAVVGVGLMPYLARGFPPEKITATTFAFLALSPVVALQCFCSFLDGTLNANRRFILTTFSSGLIPFGTIILLLIWPAGEVFTLCVGLYLGYALKLAVQLLGASKKIDQRTFGKVELRAAFQRHRGVIAEFLFLLFSSVILGLLPVIGQSYAATLAGGSVATLSYANRLLGVGMAVIGSSVNAVVFPFLAEIRLKNVHAAEELGFRLCWTVLIVGFVLMVPAYWMLEPIVGALFERGAFTYADTRRVAELLVYYLPYVPLYVCGLILARIVVSMGASRVFIAGNLISLCIYWVGCELLIETYGLRAVAISLTAVYAVSCIYLFHAMKKQAASLQV